MPSHDRVTANHDQARAIATGRGVRGGPRKKPAIPSLTDVDCHSYRAGHHVHWMQALNSINKPEYARLSTNHAGLATIHLHTLNPRAA